MLPWIHQCNWIKQTLHSASYQCWYTPFILYLSLFAFKFPYIVIMINSSLLVLRKRLKSILSKEIKCSLIQYLSEINILMLTSNLSAILRVSKSRYCILLSKCFHSSWSLCNFFMYFTASFKIVPFLLHNALYENGK
jgi:hypothetical protein